MAKAPTPARRRAPAAAEPRLPGPATPASAAATEAFYRPQVDELAAAADTLRASSLHVDDGVSADQSFSPDADGPDEETYEAKVARIRAIRQPLGSFQQKLAYAKREGYQRHWFNDSPGRVDEAGTNGWAHVKGKDGQPVARVVGSGRDNAALKAYLMEIPSVIWQEDMDARHADAAGRMASLKAAPFRAQPGTMQASDNEKFYSPSAEALSVERR